MNRTATDIQPCITGLGTAVPEGRIDAAQFTDLNARICNATPRQRKFLQRLTHQSSIEQRHSVTVEIQGNVDGQHPVPFYLPNGSSRRPTTAERMAFYDTAAPELAERAAREALTEPGTITHLVTVSCTGFAAPGWEIGLIERLGLPATVQRTHLGFMGCHGGINGLRVAAAFAAQPGSRVLMVALELCTLHYQDGLERDNLLPNTLFADGAAAVVVESGTGESAMPVDGTMIRFVGSGSQILPDSRGQMSWQITDTGFRMTLDAKVPQTIARHLAPAVDELLARHGLSRTEVAGWVIHPGGPRILDAALEALGLDPGHGEPASRTLARYGNMSSPTVLFILRELIERHRPKGPIFMMAFGPGLAAELALLEVG